VYYTHAYVCRAQVVESAQPIIAIAKGLLEPHLNELFRVIQPAMVGQD
jgi:hypothetical protein